MHEDGFIVYKDSSLSLSIETLPFPRVICDVNPVSYLSCIVSGISNLSTAMCHTFFWRWYFQFLISLGGIGFLLLIKLIRSAVLIHQTVDLSIEIYEFYRKLYLLYLLIFQCITFQCTTFICSILI